MREPRSQRNHNPENERIKRRYLAYLKEARRQSDATIDGVADSLARFEATTSWRSFKAFHVEQAIAFKQHLVEAAGQATGKPLSQATRYSILANVKRFFQWLAGEPGYRSKLTYSEAEYFNMSENESRIATARRESPFPTLEQVKHVIARMPVASDIQRRNRALVAFTLLTGMRDGAIATVKLKHVDLTAKCVHQDAREMKTKFAKSFDTFFFPVGSDIEIIVAEWVQYLRKDRLFGNDDPLFPSTAVAPSGKQRFEVVGLGRTHWSGAAAIRTIFRESFVAAGLPYYNPHSLRKTLGQLGQILCKSAEDFKAWSQNLGHESVLTTLYSYGQVGRGRQSEIIQRLAHPDTSDATESRIAKAVARELSQMSVPRP